MIEINKKSIVLSKQTKEWCKRPYEDHLNGCPNVDKCKDTPFFGDIIDNYNHFYLIILELDFKKYKKIRKEIWIQKGYKITKRRVKCLLYWQNSVVSLLKKYIIYNIFQKINNNNLFLLSCGSGFTDKETTKYQKNIYSQEAAGINVLSTYRLNKIAFERNPVNKIVLSCLLSTTNKLKLQQQKKMF